MAVPLDNIVAPTGDPRIDGLVQGSAWDFGGGARVLTYSLSLNDSRSDDGLTPLGGHWTSEFTSAVRTALTLWSDVANITFVESGSGDLFTHSAADLAFTLTGDELGREGAVALGVFPSSTFVDSVFPPWGYAREDYPKPEGDVFFDNYDPVFRYPDIPGTAGFALVLHEIGHALGLKHTWDDGANGRPTFQQLGLTDYEHEAYTVMAPLDPGELYYFHAAMPMPLDILAIQRIYGANTSFRTGNDIYQSLNTYGRSLELYESTYMETIWDAGGHDMLAAMSVSSPSEDGVLLDLRPGAIMEFQYGHVLAIAFGTIIEDAMGSWGDDVIIGNDWDNTLWSGGGSDWMGAGRGDDNYVLSDPGTVVELAGEGTDTVTSYHDYTLPANVEHLLLDGLARNGVGNELDNRLIGTSAENTLRGGAGDDYLDGGVQADVLIGGTGNDTYVVDVSNVRPPPTSLQVRGDAGHPLFDNTRVTFTPPAFTFTLLDERPDGFVDGLRLDFANGTDEFHVVYSMRDYSRSDYRLQPGAFSAKLYNGTDPNATPDRPEFSVYASAPETRSASGMFSIYSIAIDSSGPAPVLASLHSSFEFYANGSAPGLYGTLDYNHVPPVIEDSVIELAHEGVDTVRASASFILPDHVEHLLLSGASAIDGWGNALANTLTGNAAANVLSGEAGNDTLYGVAGNDILIGGTGLDTAGFSSPRAAYSIARTPSSITVSGPDGSDTLAGIERLRFSDVLVELFCKYATDWNGDAMSDLAVRQNSTGTLQLLQLSGSGYTHVRNYAWGPDWQVRATHVDFTGEGKSDLILQRISTGTLQLLQMDGPGYVAARNHDFGAGWQLASASADFNGDGKSDLVLRHSATGTIRLLEMDGLDYTSSRNLPWGPDWQLLDSRGDFNGDGRSDLVLRQSSTGTLQLLEMNGLSYTSARNYAWGSDWTLVSAAGDFNGDGRSDLVLRQISTGTIQLLRMDGLNHTGSRNYAYGLDWTVVDARGDVNGDGRSDLVWRQGSTGKVQILQMDDLFHTGSVNAPGSNWQTVDASGDFNGDGKSDLLLTDASSGMLRLVHMNGSSIAGSLDYAWGPDWQPVLI